MRRRIVWIVVGLLAAGAAGAMYRTRLAEIRAREAAVTQAWTRVDQAIRARAAVAARIVALPGISSRDDGKAISLVRSALRELAGARHPGETIAANERLKVVLPALLEEPRGTRASLGIASNPTNPLRLALALAEDAMFVEVSRYNESVKDYNVLIQLFPGNVVARLAGFRQWEAYVPPASP